MRDFVILNSGFAYGLTRYVLRRYMSLLASDRRSLVFSGSEVVTTGSLLLPLGPRTLLR